VALRRNAVSVVLLAPRALIASTSILLAGAHNYLLITSVVVRVPAEVMPAACRTYVDTAS
jgi:hypothetical protein